MGVRTRAEYVGDFQVELEHGPSRSRIRTDIPVDNGGMGRGFSPTDLLTAALASCILTIMAKAAAKQGLDLKGAAIELDKEMSEKPRRVGRFSGTLKLPAGLSPEQRRRLRAFIKACPVHESLHPDVKVELADA